MARENSKMASAKLAKKDEFYTQYEDIQKEINKYLEYDPDTFRDKTVLLPCDDPEWSNFTRFFAQNFDMLGLKKLISTSYATNSKKEKYQYSEEKDHQLSFIDLLTDFESTSPKFDKAKTKSHGKIFTLEKNVSGSGVDINNLQWDYLDGDGDFRSSEICNLRDEADIIITNPPFSLFTEFLSWILEANKKFLIIGNINCITYQEVFPRIKENKIWIGNGMGRWISGFIVPDNYELYGTEARIEDGKHIVSTNNCLWLTNLEHGNRHKKLQLMTMADNIRYSKHSKVREQKYPHYDNYDAIDVPFTDAIPSDYDGIMGVPISFLDKYNPEQFEIIGNSSELAGEIKTADGKIKKNPGRFYINGNRKYDRIAIKKKQ